MVGENFDCKRCKRKNFICPMTDQEIPDDLEERLEQAHLPSSMPEIFKYENIRVCPKVKLSDFSSLVIRANNWFEKGQLGMTFLDAPIWVDEAFSILNSERNKALKFIHSKKRAEKKR